MNYANIFKDILLLKVTYMDDTKETIWEKGFTNVLFIF